MSDWIILLLIAGGVVFIVSSWWGVRRLQARHARSAVQDEPHGIAPDQQRVAVILNPIKNRADEAKALIQRACLAAGWEEPRFYETTAEDPGYSQAREALEEGADVVLVGGGDGTVRAVAEVLAGTQVAMGLIPLGTGNLLARNVGADLTDLYVNIQTALHGQQRFIDTARMRVENSQTGESSEHAFLVIAGIGMDAEVLSDTNAQLKKAVGWLAYTEAGVRHLPGRRKRVSITLDDGPEQVRKIRSVLFANCGLVPGGIDFIPQAMIDDGMLDVVVMSPRTLAGWLVMYFKIVFKHAGALPFMTVYRSGKIVIKCAEPMPTQLDGDPAGEATKVTVRIHPLSLLIRVKPTVVAP
ncbi:diacylglycerol kinase family protein [Pseudarthrobacter sp. J75]|uniref:diacylglycerol/lipid kinase family protein n=1 Tax=unclassified Pseudarthrobacter TaxID=2647000 RepID=UPI002E8188A2|nr:MULTISPECIES: diacylglycerol kinase family protein [unclassified Pseudarthrobacter]MEE2522028.1 diacylglycerol kinase family protein [Pseudarthrobacter sp. J47]MEE2528953.1 diacylglycerol kinase family protein [Pseudarthrobacter sp. J75]